MRGGREGGRKVRKNTYPWSTLPQTLHRFVLLLLFLSLPLGLVVPFCGRRCCCHETGASEGEERHAGRGGGARAMLRVLVLLGAAAVAAGQRRSTHHAQGQGGLAEEVTVHRGDGDGDSRGQAERRGGQEAGGYGVGRQGIGDKMSLRTNENMPPDSASLAYEVHHIVAQQSKASLWRWLGSLSASGEREACGEGETKQATSTRLPPGHSLFSHRF